MPSFSDADLPARTDRDFTRFSFELRERRDCGHVLLELADLRVKAPDVLVLDALAVRVGGSPLGDDWIAIGREDAHALLCRVFARDLSMNATIMPHDEAGDFARRFLGFFGPQAHFFTNSPIVDEDDLESTWTGSWKPLTKATFDTGVAVVDEARAGLCWVTDED